MAKTFLAANPLPLAMAEISQPSPTSRAFIVELQDGDRMHVSFITIPKNHKVTNLHRPCNHDINETIRHLANQHPLKDF